MKERTTTWFGMRFTLSEKERIRRLAARDGLSAKEAVLRLVERELAVSKFPKGSFLYGLDDIIGSAEGPGDLSTNPDYMDGFGEDVSRP